MSSFQQFLSDQLEICPIAFKRGYARLIQTEYLDREFEILLDYLKTNRYFDFTGYKRPSLLRRIQKRMCFINMESFSAYQDYLRINPDEFNQLFNSVLINVTGFFRDEESWNYLRSDIVPCIIKTKRPEEPIRIWSAGCSSGEEAYALAICFAEELGVERFIERVKIFATDIDDNALLKARKATYSNLELDSIPENLRIKYFNPCENGSVFRHDMRRSVIFGSHDIVQEAPISKLDLLVCRNTMIYLNAETQSKVLSRMHFALNNNGYLFLGKAEMLLTRNELFTPVSVKHRIFCKSNKTIEAAKPHYHDDKHNDLLKESILDNGYEAEIGVDAEEKLIFANKKARALFALSKEDLGCPLRDLEISYRPVELRPLIDRCLREKRSIHIAKLQHDVNGKTQQLKIRVNPHFQNCGEIIGCSVVFRDVTDYDKLLKNFQKTNHALEAANEELQTTQEELETTNEELQSSNSALETTNEELHSTNEELETMNEELQFTNKELEAANEELRELTRELKLGKNSPDGFLLHLDEN